MQLPTDRESLLGMAARIERDLPELAAADDPELAATHAYGLFTLGRIGHQLGEWETAERRFDEAANAFWELGSRSDRQFAASMRLSQASMAMADGRDLQALGIVERMIEQFDGFPDLGEIPEQPALGLRLWLTLLEKTGEYERLHEATGVALALLDPAGSTAERDVLAIAVAQRARSADNLGYAAETLVELYEQAINALEGLDVAGADEYLDHAILRVAPLLGELERTEEANAAFARVIERFTGNEEPEARAAVGLAQAWLTLHAR